MTPSKTGRGRPKGTGLNDAAQLRAIANLMATHPDLKPTTAIKTLGISDPSVIRRLRDKYSALESQLIAEIAPGLPLKAEKCAALVAPAVEAPIVAPAVMLAANGNLAATDRTSCARVLTLSSARAERKIEPAPSAEPAAQVVPSFVPVEEVSTRPQRPRHFPLPSETKLGDWIGMGLSLYALGFEAQCAVAGTMFQWPPLAAVLRSQVAFTQQIAIAMTGPVTGSSQTG